MESHAAAFLRERARDDVLALSPFERMALALALGDDDVARYMAASLMPGADSTPLLTSTA